MQDTIDNVSNLRYGFIDDLFILCREIAQHERYLIVIGATDADSDPDEDIASHRVDD